MLLVYIYIYTHTFYTYIYHHGLLRAVKIGNPRCEPELLVESVLQIVGYELGPTERTGPVVVVHPRVDAAPVEDMAAVDQIPDLIVSVKLVKTHRAALGLVDQIRELHHRQELPDQHRGH
ncbi:unnamed protein product [Camellia sinensis]